MSSPPTCRTPSPQTHPVGLSPGFPGAEPASLRMCGPAFHLNFWRSRVPSDLLHHSRIPLNLPVVCTHTFPKTHTRV